MFNSKILRTTLEREALRDPDVTWVKAKRFNGRIYEPSQYPLTLGEINEQAKSAFSLGQCLGLSIALHEQTKWPMVAVASSSYADSNFPGWSQEWNDNRTLADFSDFVNKDFTLVHQGVQPRSDRFLDIKGYRQPKDVLEYYRKKQGKEMALLQTSLNDLQLIEDQLFEQDMVAAGIFALAVLEKYGIDGYSNNQHGREKARQIADWLVER